MKGKIDMSVRGGRRYGGKLAVLAAMLGGALSVQQACWAQGGRDALFDDDDALPVKDAKAKPAKSAEVGQGVKGFLQFEMARTTEAPTHWSKLRTRGEIGSQGSFGEGLKWKANVRLDYDAVFGVNNVYPGPVADNQRANASLRETYLDVGAGDWDFRFGRQHVVWGEMVGMFFADVVSARDLREFILPDFDALRTPQWAARAEYFKDDFHAELLWVPVATYDEIGKPGAEFYPYQPVPEGFVSQYRNEVRPARNLGNGNYGVRFSTLKGGWDVSGFFYRSMDITPTFYREIALAPVPTMTFQARHERISQTGGTVAKDFGSMVLKGEAVYTRGRKFGVLNATDVDGVEAHNTLDWAAGLDFTLPAETRFNVQLFQSVYFDRHPDIVPEKRENGYSLYLHKKIGNNWEAQATWMASLNRTDWLFRPRVQWNFEKNWRLLMGADIFKGPSLGLFGQYANRDRVYSEVRYSF